MLVIERYRDRILGASVIIYTHVKHSRISLSVSALTGDRALSDTHARKLHKHKVEELMDTPVARKPSGARARPRPHRRACARTVNADAPFAPNCSHHCQLHLTRIIPIDDYTLLRKSVALSDPVSHVIAPTDLVLAKPPHIRRV